MSVSLDEPGSNKERSGSPAPGSNNSTAGGTVLTANPRPISSGDSSPPRNKTLTEITDNKYWKLPSNYQSMPSLLASPQMEDVVIIHVCDETQQITRDFCCKRSLLTQHMKYFQKFLNPHEGSNGNNGEGGYDDIDISVHCDVEIFEWLMSYIHDAANPPKIDKSIIVSILISSEFLQMDSLVEHCIQQMVVSLNDIVKLPIDLSCISEKLVNRIAALVHPKVSHHTLSTLFFVNLTLFYCIANSRY